MKIFLIIATVFLSGLACAKETIKIMSPYSASHSGTPAMMKIIEMANQLQNTYTFVLDFKPGGNQTIAVKSLDQSSLAIIAPAFVENVANGSLNESDYVPVHALGDACWTVITNGNITSQKELVVGGVGIGNATHLTALALGDRFKFKVKYIVFRSNNDALINMAGNNGIFMVIDKYESYETMKTVNPQLMAFAVSCPSRISQASAVPTLNELGIHAPYVFNITVALRSMPEDKRNKLADILNRSQRMVGAEEIYKLSAIKIPAITAEQFFAERVQTVRELQKHYRKQIDQSQQ